MKAERLKIREVIQFCYLYKSICQYQDAFKEQIRMSVRQSVTELCACINLFYNGD